VLDIAIAKTAYDLVQSILQPTPDAPKQDVLAPGPVDRIPHGSSALDIAAVLTQLTQTDVSVLGKILINGPDVTASTNRQS
jgi:hypothetical protein